MGITGWMKLWLLLSSTKSSNGVKGLDEWGHMNLVMRRMESDQAARELNTSTSAISLLWIELPMARCELSTTLQAKWMGTILPNHWCMGHPFISSDLKKCMDTNMIDEQLASKSTHHRSVCWVPMTGTLVCKALSLISLRLWLSSQGTRMKDRLTDDNCTIKEGLMIGNENKSQQSRS
jgi:hypothetical protein